MNRRRLLQAAATAFLPVRALPALLALSPGAAAAQPRLRARPGTPDWPSQASWDGLRQTVGGRLVEVRSPLTACVSAPAARDCAPLFRQLKNPYFLGDEPGLTQTLGWVDAWTSRPSIYAVAAESADDVAAAVNFARQHNLRLVVKGGGHSYQGTSNAPDSLLVWTRRMTAITMHDAFVGAGCDGRAQQQAVSVGAGTIWGQVYDAVAAQNGHYVQGGGCLTVGVAGLVQSGGFGSFSKRYGTAAASLLEAEIVTADGRVQIANACTNPDLFWAIKGGGGGSFGVVTRLTLKTHALPEFFGAVLATITAATDAAFRRLVAQTVRFYREELFNPHWGEQIALRPNNTLQISMLFQGLTEEQVQAVWRPFLDEVAASSPDLTVAKPTVLVIPARQLWNPEFLKGSPGLVVADDRPGAPASNIFWAGDQGQVGQVIHGYQSVWLPSALLDGEAQDRLADALFAASRHRGISLHFNKGLGGAPREAVEAARDTATNPAMLDAFALLICGATAPPAYPGIPGHEPDPATARQQAAAIEKAMQELRTRLACSGSYLAESNFFERDWQSAFWGDNYARLRAVKARYDPQGLFIVHHGVGSEAWSADGFERLE